MDNSLLEIWNDINNKFPGLEFDEEKHIYSVYGKRFPSATGLISNFYVPFDTIAESQAYSLRHNFELEDVVGAWNGEGLISTTKGTRVHLFGEDYAKWKYFGIGTKPIASCKQCLAVIQFWNDLPKHIIPVALEVRMYSIEYGYCGTADILLYNTKTGECIIADYKTNKELYGSDFDKALLLHINPFHRLSQNNIGKYTIQLCFYQILLETVNIKVSKRWIVWLNEQDKKLYNLIPTKDVSNDLKIWLKNNSKKVL